MHSIKGNLAKQNFLKIPFKQLSYYRTENWKRIEKSNNFDNSAAQSACKTKVL